MNTLSHSPSIGHTNPTPRRTGVWSALIALPLTALALFAPPAIADQICEASDHGMRAEAEDNTAALADALKACAGKTLHIAAGTYRLAPNGFAAGLTVPGDTTIAGDGADRTVLKIAGTGNFQGLLWIRNVSHVTIRGIRFEGSTYESGCTRHLDYGHAVYLFSDAGDHPSVEGVEIADNEFRDFNGQSWITINAADGSPGIGHRNLISIKNNVFDSDANLRGSCAGTGGIGYPAAMIWVHGSDKSGQGTIENVSVASNTFNAGYIKSAVAIWSGTAHISVQYNKINDAGARLPPAPGTELGRYAISIYNSAHEQPGLHPDDVSVIGNQILNPVSCGIYVAVAQNLRIEHNRISGQIDRFDGTLPKGAIALNHASRVNSLTDNELSNNYIGISSVASEVSLGNNRIVPAPGGRTTKIRGGDPNSR